MASIAAVLAGTILIVLCIGRVACRWWRDQRAKDARDSALHTISVADMLSCDASQDTDVSEADDEWHGMMQMQRSRMHEWERSVGAQEAKGEEASQWDEHRLAESPPMPYQDYQYEYAQPYPVCAAPAQATSRAVGASSARGRSLPLGTQAALDLIHGVHDAAARLSPPDASPRSSPRASPRASPRPSPHASPMPSPRPSPHHLPKSPRHDREIHFDHGFDDPEAELPPSLFDDQAGSPAASVQAALHFVHQVHRHAETFSPAEAAPQRSPNLGSIPGLLPRRIRFVGDQSVDGEAGAAASDQPSVSDSTKSSSGSWTAPSVPPLPQAALTLPHGLHSHGGSPRGPADVGSGDASRVPSPKAQPPDSPSAPAIVQFSAAPAASSTSTVASTPAHKSRRSWLGFLRDVNSRSISRGWSDRTTAELQRWEVSSRQIDWFKRRKELGRGSFGVVYEVQIRPHGTRAAAKRFDVSDVTRGRTQLVGMLSREFRAMARVNHPNLVRILGVVIDDPTYTCLLMEVADCGSLREMLEDRPDRIVGEAHTQLSLAHDIASGMAYLHARRPVPMLHHDLKSRNVLLHIRDVSSAVPPAADAGASSGSSASAAGAEAAAPFVTPLIAKIGDFGLSTGISRTSYGESTTARVGGGTLAYKAPEAFRNDYTIESEAYSFAIIAWELLTGERPWRLDTRGRQFTDAAIVMAVISGERPPLPAEVSISPVSASAGGRKAHALLKRVMRQSWDHDPHLRPSFAALKLELGAELSRAQVRRDTELLAIVEERENEQEVELQPERGFMCG